MKILFFIALFFTLGKDAFAFEVFPARLKVLIVPGHDNENSGAQYGTLREADMNLELATKIYNQLKEDGRIEPYITRDENGYVKEFTDYYLNHKKDIITFLANAKKKMKKKLATGAFVKKSNTPHQAVSDDIALRLYGFNKWANDNNADVVVHVHFNDYSRPSVWAVGEREGFAIYMPDSQFVNASPSRFLAKDIHAELSKNFKTSDYIKEQGGLVSEQKLIAIGASGTLEKDVASVLVEYGYIYKFGSRKNREKSYRLMADATFKGIDNYLFNK